MFKSHQTKSGISALLVLALSLWYSALGINFAYAGALNTLSDTMSSLKVSTASNHDILFNTPTGITAGQTVTITFPGSFAIGTFDFNDVDVLLNGSQQTVAASNAASTWGAVKTSSTVITLTAPSSGTLPTAGQTLRIKLGTNATQGSTGTHQITNDSSTGSKQIAIGGTMADSGNINVYLVSDDTVQLTATVNQSISFAIVSATSTAFSNAIYFGTLGSGAVKYASSTNTSGDTAETVAHNLQVSTNAPSGYTITVQGQTLTSQQNAANTIDFIGGTAASSAAGTEQFGIRATKSGGSGATIDATYSGGSTYGYDGTATTTSAFSVGTSPTNTETYSLRYLANISALTEAGTYAASLEYVATANY
jgi:hypothetical protein